MQAVSVGVGTDDAGNTLSNIDLFPGGFLESFVFTNEYCGGPNNRCPASSAGLWDFNSSRTVVQNIAELPAPISAYESRVAWNQTGTATQMLDTMSLNTIAGQVKVDNTTIAAIHGESIRLPGGQTYSPSVGILSLGGPDGTKQFDNATGWTFPGYLYSQNVTPSNSAGLHYGSASLGLNGSLAWGGYDQSRVIGPVGSFSLFQPEGLIMPSLLDISIGVETGSSPFNTTAASNLLERNNSIGPALPTLINPSIPYMYMSPQTCANIASYLPVTLQSSVGLYIWDTASPAYSKIVSSPAYLAFTFQSSSNSSSSSSSSSSPAANLTIKVPFALLNLTLESPIVPSRQQYFPCQPFHAIDGSGYYFLGRSFLQAAFLGINWNQSAYFLAQAPGPGAEGEKLQPIGTGDSTLPSSLPAEKFAESWNGHWTPLSASDASDSPSAAASSNDAGGQSNGLSKGAIAGAVIGSVFGAVALAGMCVLLWRRRKHQQRRPPTPPPKDYPSELKGEMHGVQEKDGRDPLPEVEGNGFTHEKSSTPRYEAEAVVVHEAPAQ